MQNMAHAYVNQYDGSLGEEEENLPDVSSCHKHFERRGRGGCSEEKSYKPSCTWQGSAPRSQMPGGLFCQGSRDAHAVQKKKRESENADRRVWKIMNHVSGEKL